MTWIVFCTILALVTQTDGKFTQIIVAKLYIFRNEKIYSNCTEFIQNSSMVGLLREERDFLFKQISFAFSA